MHRERRGLGVVNEHGDAAIGVDAQEVVRLLLVGGDADLVEGKRRVVFCGELLEQDLDFLAIGSGLRDEVEALCVFDNVWRLRGVE